MMELDDLDFWILIAAVGLLGLAGLITAKVTARHEEQIEKLSGDVSFLMDCAPVPHETGSET